MINKAQLKIAAKITVIVAIPVVTNIVIAAVGQKLVEKAFAETNEK